MIQKAIAYLIFVGLLLFIYNIQSKFMTIRNKEKGKNFKFFSNFF